MEGILVLAVVAILTVSSVVIIKPAAHLSKAKDAQRTADVRALLAGIYQYANDHHGNFPVCIDETVRNVCAGRSCDGVVNSCNLYPLVGRYLVAIPVDPAGPNGNDSNYDIQMTPTGRIIVSAPETEKSETISVSR